MKIIAAISLVAALAACGDNIDTSDGAACAADEACASGLCVTAFANDREVAGGLCTRACEWEGEFEDTCPEGEWCLQYNRTGEKYCYASCTSDEDCRGEEGWDCRDLGFGIQACLPPL